MQEEIHQIIITSKRETGEKEDFSPFAFRKGMNLTFIAAPTGVEPPYKHLYFRVKKNYNPQLPPCPGCEYEKKKGK